MGVGSTIRGADGSVGIGSPAVTVAKITSWSLNKKADVSPVTASGHGGWEQYTSSEIKGWSGNFEGFLLAGVDDLEIGTEVDIELVADDNVKYSGKAFITSEDVTLNVPGTDSVKVARSFQGTGALTKADTTV